MGAREFSCVVSSRGQVALCCTFSSAIGRPHSAPDRSRRIPSPARITSVTQDNVHESNVAGLAVLREISKIFSKRYDSIVYITYSVKHLPANQIFANHALITD